MFNSDFLDVAIGLVFLFCMVSLGATAVREAIEAVLKTRAIMLELGIRELVGEGTQAAQKGQTEGPSVTRALFSHPQIYGLFAGDYPAKLVRFTRRWNNRQRLPFGTDLPSYIPSRNFAIALLDYVARGPMPAGNAPAAADPAAGIAMDVAALRRGIAALPNARLQRSLLNALDEAGDDVKLARVEVERWYDTAMDRVSGWYRRETQTVLFLIGLIFAISLNIDAVAIGQRLLVDKEWRQALVTTAMKANDANNSQPSHLANVAALETTLSQNGFMLNAPLDTSWAAPIPFWGRSARLGGVLRALPGYIILAFAASLGASFWFDLLNRLVIIRSTVKPHEKSGEEGSKDKSDDPLPAGAETDAGGGKEP